METLHERLADLADQAPSGGPAPADLWARGKRAHRVRLASGATTAVLVAAVGTGVGVSLLDRSDERLDPAPAVNVDITLPIEYPVGEELPDLGAAPGPLAAVWLAPREPYTLDDDDAGLAPEAVGLVAGTGTIGTLPIELSATDYESPDAQLLLSPDGRMVAYSSPAETPEDGGQEESTEILVRDLVSGREYAPAFAFEPRTPPYAWADATHLIGHVAGGTDGDGWVWSPGTTPRLVNPYDYLGWWPDGTGPAIQIVGTDDPSTCQSPTIRDRLGRDADSVLCDEVAIIGAEFVLGHRNTGPVLDPNDLSGEVVALDIRDSADFPFDDPALRRLVVSPGAPHPVTFAPDLIAEALRSQGGAP